MSAVIEWIDSCDSTSSRLKNLSNLPAGFTLAAREQSAGRGQRGNSWEAEPGANLTFSIFLTPKQIPAARQFELSMLIALAVADFIAQYIDPDRVKVKWPNDIYVDDRKICGMLIENTLTANNMGSSIAGIGINVNQRVFRSDAPNPVSITNLTGQTYDLDEMLRQVADAVVDAVNLYDPSDAPQLLDRYRSRLWHGVGTHSYHEPDSPSFSAQIVDIAPSGLLTLSNGRSYAFKEIIQEI